MKYSFVIPCLAFIFLLCFAHGNDVAPLGSTVSCTLSVVTNDKPIERLYYLNGGRWETLSVPPARVSAPFKYTGADEIHFYSEPYPLGEVPPVSLGSIRLQGAAGEQLLVFVPRKGELGGYGIVALASDLASFPAGHLLLHNSMPVPVAGAFNEKLVQVEPGQSILLEYSEGEGRGMRIQLAVKEEATNKWRRIHASGIPLLHSVRWLVVCDSVTQRPWLIMVRNPNPPAVR